jgi:hypothetical protein
MFVSITRLRLRTLWYMPACAALVLRSALQAAAAIGNVSAALLAEAHRTFWTRTLGWRKLICVPSCESDHVVEP